MTNSLPTGVEFLYYKAKYTNKIKDELNALLTLKPNIEQFKDAVEMFNTRNSQNFTVDLINVNNQGLMRVNNVVWNRIRITVKDAQVTKIDHWTVNYSGGVVVKYALG